MLIVPGHNRSTAKKKRKNNTFHQNVYLQIIYVLTIAINCLKNDCVDVNLLASNVLNPHLIHFVAHRQTHLYIYRGRDQRKEIISKRS